MKHTTDGFGTAVLVCVMLFASSIASAPVQAGHGGAFLGGIAVAKIGQNMRDQNDYEEDQAYYSQQAYQAQAQANNSRASSPEEKISKLDSLLKGGYITQAEYNAKKKDILNNL